jgi:uncharacterized small protein (DUF1192 family)
MQNENMIHCKVFYNNEFRRFPLSRGFSLSDLTLKIKTILSLDADFIVKYKDEEEDWITISSDLELETGLSLCNSNLFRLTVTTVSAPQTTSHEENAPTCPGATDEKDCDLYVPYHKRHGRKMRHHGRRRCHDNEDDECGDKKEGEDDHCGGYKGKGRRGRWGRGRGKGRWGHHNHGDWHRHKQEAADSSSGESNEEDLSTLSLSEIKKEIDSLREEVALLIEKKSKFAEECKEVKERIRAKRQDDNATKEEILDLKTELQTKKSSFSPIWAQIRSNRRRIRKLQELAATKGE